MKNRFSILKKFFAVLFVLTLAVSYVPQKADAYLESLSYVRSQLNHGKGEKYFEDYGMSRANIIKEVTQHWNDGYYFGTPYVGGDWQSANGDYSYNGSPGFNCAGYVAHVTRKAGLDGDKFNQIVYSRPIDAAPWGTGSKYELMSGASNWYNFARNAGIRSYVYNNAQELLADGHAEKGDIILMFVNVGGRIGPGEDNHLGIFWGENPHDNVMLQCIAGGPTAATIRVNSAAANQAILMKTSPEEGIKLNTSSKDLVIGKGFKLVGKIYPSSFGTAVTYKSSNSAVATVASDGTVKGVGLGTAKITVKSVKGNLSAVCTVKVTRPAATVFSVNSVTYDGINLRWRTAAGVKGYTIYRKDSLNGDYRLVKKIADSTITSWTDTGLTYNKTYYYKVKPYVVYNNKAYEANGVDWKSARTALAPPKPTFKVTKTANGNVVTFNWTAIRKAYKYDVYMSTKENTGYKLVKTTADTTVKHGYLKSGNTYYYRIKAYKIANGKKIYGTCSKTITVKVK